MNLRKDHYRLCLPAGGSSFGSPDAEGGPSLSVRPSASRGGGGGGNGPPEAGSASGPFPLPFAFLVWASPSRPDASVPDPRGPSPVTPGPARRSESSPQRGAEQAPAPLPARGRGRTAPSARLRAPNSPLPVGGRRGVQCLLWKKAERPGVFFLGDVSPKKEKRDSHTCLVGTRGPEKRKRESEKRQLLAVDHSARASMKNAASCEN